MTATNDPLDINTLLNELKGQDAGAT